MKYTSLNWTLALEFSIGKKNRMRDCRILMAHDCIRKNYLPKSLLDGYWLQVHYAMHYNLFHKGIFAHIFTQKLFSNYIADHV